MVPKYKRKKFRKLLSDNEPEWWKPQDLWNHWPAQVQQILDTQPQVVTSLSKDKIDAIAAKKFKHLQGNENI